jgi:hypothetical protein
MGSRTCRANCQGIHAHLDKPISGYQPPIDPSMLRRGVTEELMGRWQSESFTAVFPRKKIRRLHMCYPQSAER